MAATTTTEIRPETLVALDWESAGRSIQPVLDFIEREAPGALIAHEATTVPHFRTGEPILAHRVTFDSRRVRNTSVHGKSYRCGFVSHIE